jgi:hypothetical protein
MRDNEFSSKNNVLLHAPLVAERSDHQPDRSKPVQNPKPYAVLQPVPGQTAKPLFTVYAYSLEQARAQVAAKVAGKTIVVALDGAGR